jgi:hypothetical protein
MLASIKGSFSVSTTSAVIVAMVVEGSFKKGDRIECPMADGTTRILSVRGIESLSPSDPSSKVEYPVALIVDSFHPSEVAIGKALQVEGVLPSRKIS